MSRRELVAGGMDESKVLRVFGLASTQNLNRKDLMDPENRRINVIVLNHRAEMQMLQDDGGGRGTTIDSGFGRRGHARFDAAACGHHAGGARVHNAMIRTQDSTRLRRQPYKKTRERSHEQEHSGNR